MEMMALYSIINFSGEFKLEANYFEGKGQGVNYFEKGGEGGGRRQTTLMGRDKVANYFEREG